MNVEVEEAAIKQRVAVSDAGLKKLAKICSQAVLSKDSTDLTATISSFQLEVIRYKEYLSKILLQAEMNRKEQAYYVEELVKIDQTIETSKQETLTLQQQLQEAQMIEKQSLHVQELVRKLSVPQEVSLRESELRRIVADQEEAEGKPEETTEDIAEEKAEEEPEKMDVDEPAAQSSEVTGNSGEIEETVKPEEPGETGKSGETGIIGGNSAEKEDPMVKILVNLKDSQPALRDSIRNLQEEIEELKGINAEYSSNWKNRKLRFAEIMQQLHRFEEDILEEKQEAERHGGPDMDEDEEEEGENGKVPQVTAAEAGVETAESGNVTENEEMKAD